MKTMKKAFALILALALVLSLSVTALAEETTYTITINNTDSGHVYEAYQIFQGDLSADKKTLSNIEWGLGVDGSAILTALTTGDTLPCDGIFEDCTSARDVAEVLGKAENETYAEAFAKVVGAHLKADQAKPSTEVTKTEGDTTTTEKYTISGLAAGYYLVKDQDDSLDNDFDAYTSYILKVVTDVSATPKAAKPTVDKAVLDETADAEEGNTNGWGETADHDMFDSFQFKLTATLPDDSNLDDYPKYLVTFHDSMSKGITFESIESVIITPKTGDAIPLTSTDYTCNATEGMKGPLDWTLTISDLKEAGVTDLKGLTVEVVYNAHLNGEAVVGAPGTSDPKYNKNTVLLEYSNNPNVEADHGKTPEDTVFVFTYEMPNTKVIYDLNEDGSHKYDSEDTNKENPLTIAKQGAGFRLYDEAGTTEIELVAVKSGETVQYYRPIDPEADPAETAVEMFSDVNGKFDIRGLDVGTYTLKETTVPDGFNKCKDLIVKVEAVHAESSDKVNATTTITMTAKESGDANFSGPLTDGNKILNLSGTELPSTGGIGTTLFYVIGSIMMVGALILMVTKKKMASSDM